ncbi:hypothetical protein MLD38_033396 [Melastoma candidum]|uniref:Uncharacterized protein n=1 Tax=Melastoma candidum TaxID=119954 RepID=A0ACB9M6B3_9MYRT|nr:hypothetical protein MLD38_033396 [Melastoma candidum]
MGRRDHRGGDLRDRLLRRYSPRRYSPGRDAGGYSPVRSIEESPHCDRKRRRWQQLDGQSNNISADVRISEEPSDHVDGGKPALSESGPALLEQLRGLRTDVEMLETWRSELAIYLEEQVREADSLTSKIHKLEDQLYLEEEECRRVNSKIKKFIRAHNRHESSLGSKLWELAPMKINILSDEEPRAKNRSSALNSRQDHGLKWDGGAEERRPQGKGLVLENTGIPESRHKKDKGLLSGVAAGDKSKVYGDGFIPPTGMAAHASDKLADVEENVEAVASLPSGIAEDAQDVQNSENVEIV